MTILWHMVWLYHHRHGQRSHDSRSLYLRGGRPVHHQRQRADVYPQLLRRRERNQPRRPRSGLELDPSGRPIASASTSPPGAFNGGLTARSRWTLSTASAPRPVCPAVSCARTPVSSTTCCSAQPPPPEPARGPLGAVLPLRLSWILPLMCDHLQRCP